MAVLRCDSEGRPPAGLFYPKSGSTPAPGVAGCALAASIGTGADVMGRVGANCTRPGFSARARKTAPEDGCAPRVVPDTAGASHCDDYRTAWKVAGANPATSNAAGMVRHSWGRVAPAGDGHAERLKLPPYDSGAAPPIDCVGLADGTDDPGNTSRPGNPAARMVLRVKKGAGGF